MGTRMLRSVLVAAFSVVAIFGALSGQSDAKSDVRADSKWPAVTVAVAVTASADGGISLAGAGEGVGS